MIIVFSLITCGIYSLMLFSNYNAYLYTASVKFIMFLIVPVTYVILSKDNSFKTLFTIKGNKKFIKISAFLGLMTFLLVITGFIFFQSFLDKNMILNGLLKEGINSQNYIFVFLHIVAVNALLEETFFRGFIFLNLYKMGYKWFAYIFSSVLFALYHTGMMISWFSVEMFVFCMFGLIVSGIIFGMLDKYCNNILGGFFLHLGANLAINLIGAYLMYKF